MTSIYLIRHGQASFGKENYDQLSELGEQQTARLGQVINARLPAFERVYLGSMLRHKQSAQQCLNAYPTQPDESAWQFDPGWNEYDHQNILAQMGEEFATAASTQQWVMRQSNPKQAFEQLFNDAIQRWLSGDYHQGYVESWLDYKSRVQQALEKVVALSRDCQSVAVFTSGGPISLISQSLLGVSESKLMSLNWTLVNAGVTKLVATSNRLFCSVLNEHTAFEGEFQDMVTYR